MANVIKHKRGSGSDPVANDLVVGEVAIRTDVGKLFTKMDNGSVAEIAGGGSDIAINTLSSSSGTGGGSATFNGSAYRFTLSAPPSVSAQQLLVSINGVIQKPVAGTGQPSEGFSVDGTDIILGDAPATGSDFFILTFKSLGVSEPADNSVTSAKIVDGAIVNADINASAAIAGSKISPDFGSQNIVTTGDLTIDTNTLHVDSSNDRVGIGTTSPSFPLSVVTSSGKSSIEIKSLGTGANDDVFLRMQPEGTTKDCFIDFGDDDDGDIGGIRYNHSNDFLTFTVNASERMRIDSSGNVGIGTTNPAYPLEIETASGDAQIRLRTLGTGSSDDTVLRFLVAGTTQDNFIYFGDAGDSNAGQIRYNHSSDFMSLTTNASERMRIDSSGKIIIPVGTTTRLGIADRTSGAGVGGTLLVSAGAARGSGQNTGNLLLAAGRGNDSANNGVIQFGYSDGSNGTGLDGEWMRIDSSGRLLVGVTSPPSADIATALTIKNAASGSEHTFLDIVCDDNESARILFSETSNNANGSIRYNFLNDARAMTFHTDGNTERMRIDSTGRLGIGTTSPASPLHIQKSGTDEVLFTLEADLGTINNRAFQIKGPVADNREDPFRFNTGNSFAFETDGTERIRIDTVGRIVPADFLDILSTLRTQGQTFVKLTGHNTSNFSVMVFGANSGGHNTASCAIALGKNSDNSRSLNAGGTVNASGNDYAEYMTKSSDFTIKKGDICGINANGKLTNKFSESITFVVKSTDPSYVGGDVWGTEEILGEKPNDDSPDLPAYEEKLEAARNMVDRIAFSGQVPVNVTNATAGQYIIPIAGNEDAITGVAKAEKDLSISEYMSSVGKVIALESDGRAKIIVKVS